MEGRAGDVGSTKIRFGTQQRFPVDLSLARTARRNGWTPAGQYISPGKADRRRFQSNADSLCDCVRGMGERGFGRYIAVRYVRRHRESHPLARFGLSCLLITNPVCRESCGGIVHSNSSCQFLRAPHCVIGCWLAAARWSESA